MRVTVIELSFHHPGRPGDCQITNNYYWTSVCVYNEWQIILEQIYHIFVNSGLYFLPMGYIILGRIGFELWPCVKVIGHWMFHTMSCHLDIGNHSDFADTRNYQWHTYFDKKSIQGQRARVSKLCWPFFWNCRGTVEANEIFCILIQVLWRLVGWSCQRSGRTVCMRWTIRTGRVSTLPPWVDMARWSIFSWTTEVRYSRITGNKWHSRGSDFTVKLCVFCFVTLKSALLARNYQIFCMLFVPKTINIFHFYLVIFFGIVCGDTKLALEISACPIRASNFCWCSKMLARFQLLLAPGNRASAYVAPWV